jgi:HD superfamily phosphodiesterase
MNNKDLEKVRDLVKPIYDRLKVWAHGWVHIQDVVAAAKEIAEGEHADSVACQIAAYCHDLGRLEEEKRGLVKPRVGEPSSHAFLSVKPTRKILEELEITGGEAAEIIEAVQLHNIRKYTGNNEVLRILQDADRSDGFRPLSILRAAAFNLQMGNPEPKNAEEIKEQVDQIFARLKKEENLRQQMIDTLDFMLEWYTKLLNTETAKRINKKGYEEVKKYRNELLLF